MRREERSANLLSPGRDPDAPRPVLRRATDLYGAAPSVDIRREIVELLLEHFDATDVLVLVKGTSVMLAGQVQSALDRQLAEDLVWSVPEVWTCDNRIEVL